MAAKILIVEDEAIVRQLLVRTLAAEGYEVCQEPDGLAGWERVQREPFDLVITDSHMPHMEGAELIQRLRGRHPDIPIVHVTGSPTRSGDEDYPSDVPTFYKPFRLEDVAGEVRRLLTRHLGHG